MNHLIGVYRIKIKITHDFPIFLPINPSIIRLPIGITSKMRCSPKENKPTRLPVNKEAMFPKGEQAHPTTKPSDQQGSDVPQRGTSLSLHPAGLFYGVLHLQTVGSAPALSERTPEGSSELSTAAHFHERKRV